MPSKARLVLRPAFGRMTSGARSIPIFRVARGDAFTTVRARDDRVRVGQRVSIPNETFASATLQLSIS
jgi:hypothetical protein